MVWNSGSPSLSVTSRPSTGLAPQRIANDFQARLGAQGVTEAEAATMVNAAHRIYCPGNVCDAPTLCT